MHWIRYLIRRRKSIRSCLLYTSNIDYGDDDIAAFMEHEKNYGFETEESYGDYGYTEKIFENEELVDVNDIEEDLEEDVEDEDDFELFEEESDED